MRQKMCFNVVSDASVMNTNDARKHYNITTLERSNLFIAERFDRAFSRRLAGGIDAESQPGHG